MYKLHKKHQIYIPTKHADIWAILKVTKIRDQGMEIQFLCCVLKYVPVV